MEYKLSLFNTKRDNHPKVATRTWPKLCEAFARPQIRREKDGLLFSPAIFDPPLRRKENVIELSLLALDCDHHTTFEGLVGSLKILNRAFAIY